MTTICNTRSGATRERRRVALDFVRNAAVLLGLWFLYASVRRITADDMQTALANAGHVLDFQRALGLPSEAKIQAAVLSWPPLIRGLNVFYMWGHFPLTGAFVAWVLLFHRSRFPVIRDALVVLTVAALVLHVAFPLAPPRMLPGFVDTGLAFGPSPYDLEASGGSNLIAAMPSLHVGWALIIAVSTGSLLRSRWRHLFWLHPLLTSIAVVVTANHYWVDAIVAGVLVLGAWEFSARLAHHRLLDELKAERQETELRTSRPGVAPVDSPSDMISTPDTKVCR